MIDLHTFVINSEECEAKKLLLVHFLGGLHGLLVVYDWLGFVDRLIITCRGYLQEVHGGSLALATDLDRWVVSLEPLYLLVAEHFPDWVPLCIVCEAFLGERLLTCVCLGSQTSALGCAHIGEPTFELLCEGCVVSSMVRMIPKLNGSSLVILLRTL